MEREKINREYRLNELKKAVGENSAGEKQQDTTSIDTQDGQTEENESTSDLDGSSTSNVDLGSLKKQQLMDLCEKKGLSKSGTKTDLIARLQEE